MVSQKTITFAERGVVARVCRKLLAIPKGDRIWHPAFKTIDNMVKLHEGLLKEDEVMEYIPHRGLDIELERLLSYVP